MINRIPLLLSFLITTALLSDNPALSHGGGLNSEGCHNETRTGGYHCHRSSQGPSRPKKPKKSKSTRVQTEPTGEKQEGKSGKTRTSKESISEPTAKPVKGKKKSNSTVIKECYDGDTCATTSGEKIRLACIDAPEMGTGGKANAAKNKLEDLVVGKKVEIKRYEKDRYGRTVAEIFTTGGQSSSESIVTGGFAEVYTQYASNCRWAGKN